MYFTLFLGTGTKAVVLNERNVNDDFAYRDTVCKFIKSKIFGKAQAK